jgi:hypothetical protein
MDRLRNRVAESNEALTLVGKKPVLH